MGAIWTWLQGKKTYILTAIAVLGVLGHAWQAGTFTMDDIAAIMVALGFSTVRHGISNASR